MLGIWSATMFGTRADPSIATIANTATGLTPTIPSHSAGQLIVLLTGTDGTSLTISSNTGVWVSERVMGTGSAPRAGVFSCVADGTNMSITLASTGSTTLNHIIYIIDNADTVDAAAAASSLSVPVNPPSHTIGAGSNRNVIWIPFGWIYGSGITATSAPTGFTDLKTCVRGSPPRWGMMSANLSETSVQTKDPAAFGGTTSTFTWYATTVGVYWG